MAQAGKLSSTIMLIMVTFSDNGFIGAVNENKWSITSCGVGAHHPNDIIENKKNSMTLGICTLLLSWQYNMATPD